MDRTGLYFKKDKKAQIYQKHTGGYDAEGYPIGDYYKPIAPASLWCYARQLSQEQLYAAHAYWNDETRLFVFNYRDDVKQGDYILYRSAWYEISRIDTTEDYKSELFVYVRNVTTPPKSNQIKPYDYEP